MGSDGGTASFMDASSVINMTASGGERWAFQQKGPIFGVASGGDLNANGGGGKGGTEGVACATCPRGPGAPGGLAKRILSVVPTQKFSVSLGFGGNATQGQPGQPAFVLIEYLA